MKTKDEVKHNFGNTETNRYTVETPHKQIRDTQTNWNIHNFLPAKQLLYNQDLFGGPHVSPLNIATM